MTKRLQPMDKTMAWMFIFLFSITTIAPNHQLLAPVAAAAGWISPSCYRRHQRQQKPHSFISHNTPLPRHVQPLLSDALQSKSAESSTLTTHSLSDQSDAVVTTPMMPALLSSTVKELSGFLRGNGRALACWDCFRLGLDPVWFHSIMSPSSDDHNDNKSHHRFVEPVDDYIHMESPFLSSPVMLQPWTRQQLEDQMPSSRRGQYLNLATCRLLNSTTISKPEQVLTLKHISTSRDGTTKLLLQLSQQQHFNNNHNNNFDSNDSIETVIIPWPERQSSTLCVSSQVGCRQACTFCATGRMGRGRNLTADEILAQQQQYYYYNDNKWSS